MYLHWGTKFGKTHPHQTAPKDLGHKGQALGRPLGPTALLRQVQGAAHSSYQQVPNPMYLHWGTKFGPGTERTLAKLHQRTWDTRAGPGKDR